MSIQFHQTHMGFGCPSLSPIIQIVLIFPFNEYLLIYLRINDCLRLLELPTHVILWISSVSRQTEITSAFPKITASCYWPRLGLFSTGTSITLCHEKHTFNSNILRYINLVFEGFFILLRILISLSTRRLNNTKVSFIDYSSLHSIDSQHVD